MAVLKAEEGEKAQAVVKAALAVRDARGRDRKGTLRKLAGEWGKIPMRNRKYQAFSHGRLPVTCYRALSPTEVLQSILTTYNIKQKEVL